MFQFQKGTIEISIKEITRSKRRRFQFQKGTIEINCAAIGKTLPIEFQFQKGTIEIGNYVVDVNANASFNSRKVQLRCVC